MATCPDDPTTGTIIDIPDITINITGVNDIPVLELNNPADGCPAKFFEEIGAHVPVVNISLLNLTDVDLDPAGNEVHFIAVTVEILNYDSGDLLSAYVDAGAVPPGLSVVQDRSVLRGEVTITVRADAAKTADDILKILENIQYHNANPNLNTDARSVNISIADEDGGVAMLTSTLCICPFNDPPVITFVSKDSFCSFYAHRSERQAWHLKLFLRGYVGK